MPVQPNMREQGRALLSDAKESGRELADRAGRRALSGADDTRRRTTQDLKSVASALRGSGSDLKQREESLLAPYVERAADQVERAAGFLETHSVDDLARGVGRFARRRPALFLGGCFAAGILVARFLKASKRRQERGSHHLPDYGPDVDTMGASGLNGTAGSYGNDLDTH